MAACRHAVHPHFVQRKQRCKARVRRDRIDGAGNFTRPALPARRTDIALVLVVVAFVLGQGDYEAGFDERAGKIRVHPGRGP